MGGLGRRPLPDQPCTLSMTVSRDRDTWGRRTRARRFSFGRLEVSDDVDGGSFWGAADSARELLLTGELKLLKQSCLCEALVA